MKVNFSRLKRSYATGEQEVAVALTYLGLSVMLHLASLTNAPFPGWEPYTGWWLPVLLAGAATIFLRRKAALPSALLQGLGAIALVGLGSISGYFLAFEAVFTIFLLCGARIRRWTFLVLCLLMIIGAGLSWASTGSGSNTVLSMFMLGFIFFTPMQWAQNVRTAKDLARSEAARAAALSEAATDREERLVAEHHATVIEERTALAREMHDVLSARLSSIALLSGALLNRVPASGAVPPATGVTVREPLEQIRSESVSGLEELTSMVRMLHAGNSSALRASLDGAQLLVDSFRGAGQRIDYRERLGQLGNIPPEVQTAAYRTLRELLVNHSRHAPTTTLELRLERHDDHLEICAQNPLETAGSTRSGAGTGLWNIRSRAQALSGSCTIRHDSQRFAIQVRFPLDPAVLRPAASALLSAAEHRTEGEPQ